MKHPDRKYAPATHPLPRLSCPVANSSKLSNGITFRTYSGGVQPVSMLSLIFQGGLECGNDLAAKFTLSQLTEGTRVHSGDEIAELIDFYGVRISPRFFTHHSQLDIYFLNDTAKEVVDLVMEIITQPTFPADRLQTARMRALNAYRTARTQMPTLASEEMQRLLYGSDHPGGKVTEEKDLEAITSEGCRECFSRLLQPDTMTVALSGLLSDEIITIVADRMSTLKGMAQGYDIDNRKPEPIATPYIKNLNQSDSFQAAVMMAIPTILRTNPDYNDLRLAVMALGGYFGSRLMKNIREDKGLTYGISAALNGTPDFAYIEITATCDRSSTDRVISEIEAEMHDLVANPPSGDELKRLKLTAESNLASFLDTPWEIMRYNLMPLLLGSPADYFSAQQNAISNLSPERIAQVAAKYITPNQAITVIA